MYTDKQFEMCFRLKQESHLFHTNRLHCFCIYVHSRGLDGAETAQFTAGYGIAPFLDYGSNVLQYAGNRGLRNQNNLVAMNNLQGYGMRGGGGFGGGVQRGNFQNGAFLNKGSFPLYDYETGYILKIIDFFETEDYIFFFNV